MQFAFTILEARKKVLYENAFDKVPKKLNFFEQETMSDQYSKFEFNLNCASYCTKQ